MGRGRVKAGTSRAAAKARKDAFVEAYCANGGNGTQAAIAAGYAPRSATVTASKLLSDPKMAASVAARRAAALSKASEATDVTVERTLRELGRIAYFDPRKLYNPDGSLKRITELDDDTVAALASVEEVEMEGGVQVNMPAKGAGPNAKPVLERVPMYTKKVRFNDKNSALEKAMKYLGLFSEDNRQKVPVLPPVINIIGVRVKGGAE